jgi:glutamate dehydrogenase
VSIPQAEIDKSAKVNRVVQRVRERVAPEDAAGAEEMSRRLFGSVTPEDVLTTAEDDLVGAACSLWHLAAERPPGEARVRVFNPTLDDDAWETPHTVVEVVNDDMPFLVSSVTAEIGRRDSNLHLVLHPVVAVRRDEAGRRLEVLVEPDAPGATRESLMHVEIDQETDPERLEALRQALVEALGAVRRVVADWKPMRGHVEEIVAGLEEKPPPLPAEALAEGREFLAWLAADHFTFLGYREYRLVEEDGETYLRLVPESGLGLLRVVREDSQERSRRPLPRGVAAFLRRKELLIVSKAHARSPVHRPVAMDYIAVRTFDADGRVTGERRFLGLFSSAAYQMSVKQVPLLRQKMQRLLERLGFDRRGHNARTLRHLLDTFPRDELFQVSDDELAEIAVGILRLQERQRVALFVRKDPFERFVSALVYVPRDRHTTRLRRQIEGLLAEAFDGTVTSFSTQVGDAPLARAHFIFQTQPGALPKIDVNRLEARIAELASTWDDKLRDALVRARGEEPGLAALRRYADAFPVAYREAVSADEALLDMEAIEEVIAEGSLATRVYRPREAAGNEVRFKVFHPAPVRPLSELLPMLEDMGLQVVWEVPYEISPPGSAGGGVWIRDFLLASGDQVEIDLSAAQDAFRQAFARVWSGDLESDGFNRLVVAAGLDWREVTILRAYGRYLRQIGIAFSQEYMAATLARNPKTARHMVALFRARFDPAARDEEAAGVETANKALRRSLQAVANLDEDRILRRFLNLVKATVRTNFFQRDDGVPKPYLAFKLDARLVRRLPPPAPQFEIWVYSPRVEAVHLRGGKVARGGIRWSDRQMDFRTEILGLMKAQMVKNAVIVPVGAKGGFVVKRGGGLSREDLLAEGRECYRLMVRGLLDLTDNRVGDDVVPPPDVVRHDGDDPYLVVAADKGTATFSDLANSIAADYGFWLGDAFASGGSAGYDHKGMGITARGAWESVKRHFRELGRDVQSEDFTAVGVGDMAGDVFGNGMLLSKHTRLVGAFNHLHVFVDPDPDPAVSWQERKRLFDLPRSSWADYDAAKLSPGGAVYERGAKSLKVSAEVRRRFALAKPTATPDELMRAMLMAEVDLLWLGGIGTFVKAAGETHGDTGDHANDDVRVDGGEVRARVVGEGANLGFTQRGRIEYAMAGGRINTDAIDNSAGVDTSDHEVNIKIAFGEVMAREGMTLDERNRLLAAMTGEVAALVLRDNYLQTQAISVTAAQGVAMLPAQGRLIRDLERSGRLQRRLEHLPDDEALAERQASGQGLTRPEIAVLLAYSKIALYQEILASTLPDEPELEADLLRYFPRPLAERHGEALLRHRLRREIIATHVTNSTVNRVGPTFVLRMAEETAATATEIARAYTITRDAFRLRDVWEEIERLDNRVPAELQIAMIREVDRLVDRATLWLLRNARDRLEVAGRVAEYGVGAAALLGVLEAVLPEAERAELKGRVAVYRAEGVPAALARFVAATGVLGAVLDIVTLAEGRQDGPVDVARVYFLLGARFRFDTLRASALAISDSDPWQKAAAEALSQDLAAHHAAITRAVLEHAGDGRDPQSATDGWLAANASRVEPADRTLADLASASSVDYAMLTVANHQLRLLAAR